MIILIIVIASVLRLVNLNQSFWLDEAAQVIESVRPFSQQLEIYADFHPPLYHLILHSWLLLERYEVFARIPSVIMGVLSVYLLYLFAFHLTQNKMLANSVAFFLAISPFHMWYSQESRPYMLFVSLSLLSSLLLIKKRWTFYVVVSVLALYSSYFMPYLLLAHGAFIWFYHKSLLNTFVKKIIIIFFAFLPWFPSFLRQISIGAGGVFVGWQEVVSQQPWKAILLTFAKFIYGKGTIDNNLLYTLVIIPVLILFSLIHFKDVSANKNKSVYLFFWIPLLAGFLTSFFLPILAPQRLLFLLPYFLLILTKSIFSYKGIYKYVTFLIVIVISCAGIYDYFSNPFTQREQWRQAVSYIDQEKKKTSAALFVFPEPFAPFIWYSAGKIEGYGISPNFIFKESDLLILEQTSAGKNRIFLFQYLTGLTDPKNLVQNYLTNLRFIQTDIKNFPGVGFIYIYDRQTDI